MNNPEAINVSPMKDTSVSWHWTDYISHYRFWAVVIGLFLMQLTLHAFYNVQFSLLLSSDFDRDMIDIIFPFRILAMILGAAFVLYGLRKRFKMALISFGLVIVIYMITFFFALELPWPILLTLLWFIQFCAITFWLTALIVIVHGRSDIKSLTIIGLNIYIFTHLTSMIVMLYLRNAQVFEALSEPWHYCLITIPAIIAIILIAFANKEFFKNAPRKTIAADPHRYGRSPVAVALLSAFVPFYYYYFMATRPRELKAISPDIKTPTGGGVIAMIVFFGFATPIWFAEMRKSLKAKHPENATLQKRSHKFIGFISILFPVFGAAMIQSDMNALEPASSGSLTDQGKG